MLDTDDVVITGVGAVCGNGHDVPSIFADLLAGVDHRAPVSAATHFDPSPYPEKQVGSRQVIASRLTNAQLEQMTGQPKPGRKDRHQLFAELAAREAMEMAGFDSKEGVPRPDRTAIIAATGDGGLQGGWDAMARLKDGRPASPFDNLKELPNLFVGYLSRIWDIQGASFVHSTACAAGTHAIMQAADHIRLGRADCVLAGGAEMAITPFGIASFAAQTALGNGYAYQKTRSGFVMGEGAAFLVLERKKTALARGATILAELAGYGATSDGRVDGSITSPFPEGGSDAARKALAMAGYMPSDVDYINAHGTGTGGDALELEGIAMWAGDDMPNLRISSTKAATGHLLGAAGALEAVLCVEMMRQGILLPTLGLTPENLDPACGGIGHVMTPTAADIRAVLSNSFGFGGTNGALIIKPHVD